MTEIWLKESQDRNGIVFELPRNVWKEEFCFVEVRTGKSAITVKYNGDEWTRGRREIYRERQKCETAIEREDEKKLRKNERFSIQK